MRDAHDGGLCPPFMYDNHVNLEVIFIMRKITFIACLLAAIVASAQFSGSGFYRVRNVATDSYVGIRGTKYKKLTTPEAFWPCVLMLKATEDVYLSDPGSIIYIPDMGETSLCAQGVSTYTLTHLWLTVDTANVQEGGKPTYVARTQYDNFPCIFRDFGVGFTAGFFENSESHWWIEPVNVGSMDTSYLGIKPVNELVTDADGWYWSTMCCDFPFLLPLDGGVEGAYTVKEIKKGTDDRFYAEPVKVYGQGDTVPAATPVLIKCKGAMVSDNKVVPVEEIANWTEMPIVNDLLMGNYFSIFENHYTFDDFSAVTTYYPEQAMLATADYLALGVDADGKLGFFPQSDGTYMPANKAWLSTTLIESDLAGMDAVYLGKAPEPEPEILIGDVNGDGKVSIRDVADLIDYLLNPEGKNTDNNIIVFNSQAADLNEDGVVNIRDLVILIERLLSNENTNENSDEEEI